MNKGFIGFLILIIIALALAKYFLDWSIFDALSTEKGMATVQYVKQVVSTIWEYVKIGFAKLHEIF